MLLHAAGRSRPGGRGRRDTSPDPARRGLVEEACWRPRSLSVRKSGSGFRSASFFSRGVTFLGRSLPSGPGRAPKRARGSEGRMSRAPHRTRRCLDHGAGSAHREQDLVDRTSGGALCTRAPIDRMTHAARCTPSAVDRTSGGALCTRAPIDRMTHAARSTPHRVDRMTHAARSTPHRVDRMTHAARASSGRVDRTPGAVFHARDVIDRTPRFIAGTPRTELPTPSAGRCTSLAVRSPPRAASFSGLPTSVEHCYARSSIQRVTGRRDSETWPTITHHSNP